MDASSYWTPVAAQQYHDVPPRCMKFCWHIVWKTPDQVHNEIATFSNQLYKDGEQQHVGTKVGSFANASRPSILADWSSGSPAHRSSTRRLEESHAKQDEHSVSCGRVGSSGRGHDRARVPVNASVSVLGGGDVLPSQRCVAPAPAGHRTAQSTHSATLVSTHLHQRDQHKIKNRVAGHVRRSGLSVEAVHSGAHHSAGHKKSITTTRHGYSVSQLASRGDAQRKASGGPSHSGPSIVRARKFPLWTKCDTQERGMARVDKKTSPFFFCRACNGRPERVSSRLVHVPLQPCPLRRVRLLRGGHGHKLRVSPSMHRLRDEKSPSSSLEGRSRAQPESGRSNASHRMLLMQHTDPSTNAATAVRELCCQRDCVPTFAIPTRGQLRRNLRTQCGQLWRAGAVVAPARMSPALAFLHRFLHQRSVTVGLRRCLCSFQIEARAQSNVSVLGLCSTNKNPDSVCACNTVSPPSTAHPSHRIPSERLQGVGLGYEIHSHAMYSTQNASCKGEYISTHTCVDSLPHAFNLHSTAPDLGA